MQNWKDYTLNGIKFTLVLNTKRHVWQVYFGLINEGPSMEFTKAKGAAIIEFLKELTIIERDRNATENK